MVALRDTFRKGVITRKRDGIGTGFHMNETSIRNNTARYHWLKDYACVACRASQREKDGVEGITSPAVFNSLSNYHSVISFHMRPCWNGQRELMYTVILFGPARHKAAWITGLNRFWHTHMYDDVWISSHEGQTVSLTTWHNVVVWRENKRW